MHSHLALNLLHFHPDLGAVYALRHAPNFYEIHPRAGRTEYSFYNRRVYSKLELKQLTETAHVKAEKLPQSIF
jgi:hypothetical protein